ncbi:DUF3631 domain-containing protein [Candidatus Methylomirabilis sp.]|uniref:DUF3631 domain-containing protein n=1 Tax=Candidatus Methylomirabilis sp. TaxID=2032687 RepID=UPI0030766626
MSGAATITLADFFAALFPDPDGLIELRALPSKRQAFILPGDIETAERFLHTHAQENIYFGVATRKDASSGALENCLALHAIFVDMDFKVTPEPQARAKIEGFLLKPSFIVRSGGGLHGYWLLREPLNLRAPEDRQQAKNLLRRLALALSGDLSSAESARVLRIPGTLNHKPEYGTPRPVQIETFNPERAYNPSDFDDLLPAEPEPVNGNGQGFTVGDKIKDGERNTTLYKLARSMKAKGLSSDAILAALRAENQAKCGPPLPDAEIEKIVAHAIAQPDRPGFAANGNGDSDPLVPLRALADSPTSADIEAALRMVIKSLAGADALKRASLRQEALSILKAKKVEGPAKLVDAAWALVGGSTDEGGAQPLTLADPEPWREPVDGAAILEEIEATLTRFLILPRGAATAIALWVLHAYALTAFAVSPILAVVSATMRCGKSTLLSLLSGLLLRALPTANITPAALFRCIEQFTPSMLVDEGDAFLAMSDELRGVLNAGHTRTAGVVRTVGEEFEPRIFKVFCPKVLAMIGKPPGTIEDRSIVISMKRKAPGEQVQRFRLKQLEELAPLCQKAARWALDHIEELRDADPDVPASLNDRAADNWRPLLAIADVAGGGWPDRARQAALTLSGGERDPEADGAGVALIGDCVSIFNDRGVDRLSTTDLIGELVKIEGRPWPEWSKGRPISPRALGRLLKPFGIVSKVLRIGESTPHGYERQTFDDPYFRYFQGSNPQQGQQANEFTHLDPTFNPQQTPDVADTKSDLTIDNQRNVADVADRKPENGRYTHVADDVEATNPGFETRCAADVGDLFNEEVTVI